MPLLTLADVNSFTCRAVKLSSPNLNYFIIAGAVLMYISIFISLLPFTDEDKVLGQCIVSNKK